MNWKPVKTEDNPIPDVPLNSEGLVLHEMEVIPEVYQATLEKCRQNPLQQNFALDHVENKLFRWVRGNIH